MGNTARPDGERQTMPHTAARRRAPYERVILDIMVETGHAGQYDPRHIEAFIRIELGTLDHLTRQEFRYQIAIARECVDIGGIRNAEDCAISFGM